MNTNASTEAPATETVQRVKVTEGSGHEWFGTIDRRGFMDSYYVVSLGGVHPTAISSDKITSITEAEYRQAETAYEAAIAEHEALRANPKAYAAKIAASAQASKDAFEASRTPAEPADGTRIVRVDVNGVEIVMTRDDARATAEGIPSARWFINDRMLANAQDRHARRVSGLPARSTYAKTWSQALEGAVEIYAVATTRLV